MAIEVKQLTIRSSVRQDADAGDAEHGPEIDYQALKEEILAECRRVVAEVLRERQER